MTCIGAFTFANTYGSSMVLQRAPAGAVVWGYTELEGTIVTVTMAANNYQNTSAIGQCPNSHSHNAEQYRNSFAI